MVEITKDELDRLRVKLPGEVEAIANTPAEAGIVLDHYFFGHFHTNPGNCCALCRKHGEMVAKRTGDEGSDK